MNIFIDFHHGGAARGQVLLLDWRLKHDVSFPNDDMVRKTLPLCRPGDWLTCPPNFTEQYGGFPAYLHGIDLGCGYDEFMETDWDAVMVTRLESQHIFKELLKVHSKGNKIKVIGMTGNDHTIYDWEFIHNFMSTDYLSYLMAPNSINKIHYSQELGLQYGQEFVPITEASLHTINCFVMCWPTFTQPWVWTRERDAWGTRCPHCDGAGQGPSPAVVPYGIWKDAEAQLSGYQFKDYGIACQFPTVPEPELPKAYASGALTVHMKTYDGYGYSMLQSIACGRPVIVPRRFHKYRTANRYLIPWVTCFEVEWEGKSLADTIRYATGSVERANHYAKACYRAWGGLADWEHEAFRVSEFLEKLL